MLACMSNIMKHSKYALTNDYPSKVVLWVGGLWKTFPFLHLCTVLYLNDEHAVFYFLKALVILQLSFITLALPFPLYSFIHI